MKILFLEIINNIINTRCHSRENENPFVISTPNNTEFPLIVYIFTSSPFATLTRRVRDLPSEKVCGLG